MGPLDELLRARLPKVGEWLPTQQRRAAVLCPLVQHDGRDHVLLLVRPADARQHAGQIAFPGGMRDGAESVEATARRETREELGIDDAAIDVLGGLGWRESSGGIQVHAVVARLRPVALRPAADEVVRVLHVPLTDLCDDARWQEKPPPFGATGKQPRHSPHFVFGDELLWGLTARFVRDLVAVLTTG